jgi:hypothetical protein
MRMTNPFGFVVTSEYTGLNAYDFVAAYVLLRVLACKTSLHSEIHLPQVAPSRPLAVSGSDECAPQGFSTHKNQRESEFDRVVECSPCCCV